MKVLRKLFTPIISYPRLGWLTGGILLLLASSSSQVAAQTVLVDQPFIGNSAFGWQVGVDVPSDPSRDKPCLTARSLNDTSLSDIPACPNGPIDSLASGVLRLTSNKNNQAGFVFFQQAIPSQNGLVISFDTFVYNSTSYSPVDTLAKADGISFFLIDGRESPTEAGAFGGSLGYAQKTLAGTGGVSGGADVPGVVGGYVGIGLDEFGNYSNPTEGRIGGRGFTPEAVAIRGSQATRYTYHGGTDSLPPGLAFPTQTTRSETIKRTTRITLTPDNKISVDIDFYDGMGFVNVISQFELTPLQGGLPPTFKFGFAASTGNSTNIHEIRTLRITTVPPDLSINKSHSPDNFTVGQNGTYTLKVRNSPSAGPTSDPITVTDTLPAGLNFVSGTGTNWSCSAVGQAVTCTYNGSGVGIGETLPDITLTVSVTGAAGSTVTNSATVSTPGNLNTGNTATITTNVIAAPILKAIKSAALVDANGNGVAEPGEGIDYTVTLSNTGNAPSTNTIFTDSIPANTTYVPNSTTLNGSPVADVAGTMPFPNGAQVNSPGEPNGQINPGESATVSFQVKIANPLPPGVNQISNQGTVISVEIPQPVLTQPPTDSGTGTPVPTVITIGTPEPRLRLVKRITAATRGGVPLSGINFNILDLNDNASVWPPGLPPIGVRNLGADTPLQSGDRVEYTIYFLSDGTSPVTNAKFCDLIPSGTTFVPNSLQAQLGTSALAGTFFSPLAPLPTGNVCTNQTNANGAVILNLGNVSNVTGSNFGFIRFRVTID